MKNVSITDLMYMDTKQYDEEISFKIQKDPEYKEACAKYKEKLQKLGHDIAMMIDPDVIFMETKAVDISFKLGFNMAIRLILSSVNEYDSK